MYNYDLIQFEFDTNGDGYVDTLMTELDLDGDGFTETIICEKDTNADGVVDTIEATTILDIDGDGYAETSITEIDDNIDGVADSRITMTSIDIDGDGYAETRITEVDDNYDNITDIHTIEQDLNFDGEYEYASTVMDSNHNGIIEAAFVSHDSNGDGKIDSVEKAYDYNEDGEIDSVNQHHDIDGDGRFETLTKMYDSDGNGEIDTVEQFVDYEGNGKADIHQKYAYNPNSNELIPCYGEDFALGGTLHNELENFDPNNVEDPSMISGDPAESIKVWEFQGNTNRCALYSEKFVIEELTGQEIDIEEFAKTASENGWFTEKGGTTLLNLNNMLDYYDIENEMSFNNDIEDIEQCLNNDGKVIVSIDADQIWYGKEGDIFSPENGANHAVQVIGIDRTDPENPMVILNDSGIPNGRGSMIPLDVFEDAWAAGNCQMVECYR